MVTPPIEVPGDVSRTVNIAIHDKLLDKFYLLRGKQGQLVIYEIENPVEVFAEEKKPLNVKELGQLVEEDVISADAISPDLVMEITDPENGDTFLPDADAPITYASTGGFPPLTCELSYSDAPIPDDAAFDLATVIAVAQPGSGTAPWSAPHDPGDYYIRGRVTDSLGNHVLSNQVHIIVGLSSPLPVWFISGWIQGGGGG